MWKRPGGGGLHEPNKGYNRLKSYNWQQSDWPNFTFKLEALEGLLLTFREKTGRLGGLLDAMPQNVQSETIIDLMVSEAIKTSEIEGAYLSRPDVLSSIRNNLGLNRTAEPIGDKRAEGIAELMLCVRNNWQKPLSRESLFSWHVMLMKGSRNVRSGAWRKHDEAMRVVSGTVGNETVHFEAPPSEKVPGEMKRFITWFNKTAPGGTCEIRWAPVRAAIAHLYFETIHPFEDGNGRIGRGLAEKAVSQGIGRPALLSLSKSIETDRSSYYAALKQGQRSNEITPWIVWFTGMLLTAQNQAEAALEFTLKKTRLFDRVQNQLNERQLKALRRMLKDGPDGFEGGMSAEKYKSITGTTKPTATRDLRDLVEKEVFVSTGGGRSVRYHVKL
ncbi:MAG: Fic family protein [Kiritimatiellia bacterium]